MNALGFALTLHGDLDETRQVHEQVLASGQREGSKGVQGVALVGLAITALRGGDVEVVRGARGEGLSQLGAGILTWFLCHCGRAAGLGRLA